MISKPNHNNKTAHMKYLLTLLALVVSLTNTKATDYLVNAQTPQHVDTPFTNTLSLAQFNPAWGKLTNVVLQFNWSNFREAFLWNLSTNDEPYKITYTNTVTLRWPSGSVFYTKTHDEMAKGILNPGGGFDGNIVNAGGGVMSSCVHFPPAIAPWVGTGTLPFTVSQVSVIDVSTMNWSNPLLAGSLATDGWFSVGVKYQYTAGTGVLWPCH